MHGTMKTVKWMYTLALFFMMVAILDASICTTYCSRIYCANFSEDNCDGILVTGGSYCGCCDACFRTLSRGETCRGSDQGLPITSICQSGTSCIDGICQ